MAYYDYMPKKNTQKSRLRRAGIKHYDELIHDQSREWLIKNFSAGADEYPVNVARLMRNIIWQLRERIIKKQRAPLKELIRTFWYMHVKPTLSRAGALAKKADQYAQLIDNMVSMVKKLNVLRYKDIGFRDDNLTNRKAGANANIILFSEKAGHQNFLADMADKYNVSIIALGGQPSVLNVEYFVDELKKTGINLQRSFYLFSIVDYDTSGWIIRDAFIDDLRHYGISRIQTTDLIHPDMLTPEEIEISRYLIPAGETMRIKNKNWIKQVRKQNYINQKLLEEQNKKGKTILYGLEAESISGKRLAQKLERIMVPLIGKNEDLLKIYELKQIDEAIKKLLLYKLTGVYDA